MNQTPTVPNETIQPSVTTAAATVPNPNASSTNSAGSTSPNSGELSGGATAAIGTGIGVGNVCCSPFCYGCPTLLSSIVGLILYFSWKQEKPKTAHTILVVTLVTGGIGMLIFAGFFLLGLTGAILDEFNY